MHTCNEKQVHIRTYHRDILLSTWKLCIPLWERSALNFEHALQSTSNLKIIFLNCICKQIKGHLKENMFLAVFLNTLKVHF